MGILVAELQHRTRNLIGVVMAMVNRSAVAGQTLDEFKASLNERFMALARVQGLLSRGAPGDGVAFDELLKSELSAQSGQYGEAVTLHGPDGVVVRSVSVQALAMALHELTTNAVKYGALGQKKGRLNIRWWMETKDGLPWINIDWKETGVDTARPAVRKFGGGSGRRLIEDALPYQFGARTAFTIEPDGLHCTIALPLSEPQSEEVKDGQSDAP